MNQYLQDMPEGHMRAFDRVLVLEAPEGKAKNTMGVLDNRIFTGENKLHLKMDLETNLWRFHYDSGTLPDPLRGTFTSFKKGYDHAALYFSKRNIKITEVKD